MVSTIWYLSESKRRMISLGVKMIKRIFQCLVSILCAHCLYSGISLNKLSEIRMQ